MSVRQLAFLYVVAITALCLFAPALAFHDPLSTNPSAQMLQPSETHWAGTDYLGRDIWSRFLYGGQLTLSLTLLSSVIAIVPGALWGIAAGWWRWVDRWAGILLYTLLSVPPLILALLIASLLPASWYAIAISVALAQIAPVMVIARSTTISIRSSEYLKAAQALGAGQMHLLSVHVWPNTAHVLKAYAGIVFAYCLLMVSALGFLGIGFDASYPEWGVMLAESRYVFRASPWPALLPGIAITSLVLAVQALARPS